MNINTLVKFRWDGTQYVEVYSESYEYQGPIANCGLETWMMVGMFMSTATGIYMATRSGPSIPAPPPPAGAQTVNPDGSVTVQRWDADTNSYITEFDPEPEGRSDPGGKRDWIIEQDAELSRWVDADGNWIAPTSQGIDNESGQEEFRQQGYPGSIGARQVKKLRDRFDSLLGENDTNYHAAVNEYDEGGSDEWREWKIRDDKRTAETELRDSLTKSNLEFLDAPPEERVAQYEKYRDEYVTALKEEINPEFEKRATAIEQNLDKKGLTGSTAHAQFIQDHEELVTKTNTAIEHAGYLQAKEFEAADTNTALNVLNYLESGKSGELTRRMSESSNVRTNAAMGNAYQNAMQTAEIGKSALQYERDQNMGNTMLNTAGGLAYLYGYNKGGTNIKPDRTPASVSSSYNRVSPGYKPTNPYWSGGRTT